MSASSEYNNNSSSNTNDNSDVGYTKEKQLYTKKQTGEASQSQTKHSQIPSIISSTTHEFTTESAKKQRIQNTKPKHNVTNQRQAQAVIEEMNRHYDHNICLDRFINEIEQNQKHQSPSNSSMSSSSSNMPRSNEDSTDSSHNSSSIKSNQGTNQKDSNVNSSNSSNTSNSSKDNTMRKHTEEALIFASKSSESDDKSSDQSRKQISAESGIGCTEVDNDDSITSQNISSSNLNDHLEKSKNYKGGKLGRKRKRGYIYNPKPVIEKPPKQFVPEQEKDKLYWDKRQRNNEAAKRSREMRHLKEKETHEKLDRLSKENEALRVAITLLIQRNKNLEFIIGELEQRDNTTPALNPVVASR